MPAFKTFEQPVAVNISFNWNDLTLIAQPARALVVGLISVLSIAAGDRGAGVAAR